MPDPASQSSSSSKVPDKRSIIEVFLQLEAFPPTKPQLTNGHVSRWLKGLIYLMVRPKRDVFTFLARKIYEFYENLRGTPKAEKNIKIELQVLHGLMTRGKMTENSDDYNRPFPGLSTKDIVKDSSWVRVFEDFHVRLSGL